MYISDTLESGELSLDNIIAELPEGAEDKAVVTGPEVQTNKKLSTEEKALLDQAEKDAKEQVSQATDALVQALESLENAVIEDIKKDASTTDKEAAIKAAKEVIGKDAILKAIEEGDIDASDLLANFLAEDSDQVTPAEAMSQEDFSSQDQAKLAVADKEAAEENSNAKKLELSKLEEQVAKIKAQLSSLQVSGDKNSQVKDLQQALVDYEDAIKTLSSVMSAVLEIEDFKGGVNAIEAATAELPEYTGSVAPLAANPTLGTEQDRTYKAPAATDEQLLPNTGSQDASAVASLGFVGLLLGLLPFAKRKLNK
ncbi:Merozoite surface protein 3 alpha [Streptococcus oralis]|uniref:Merozoite surface protein 3 alpha n=2 Tax=Streptococcus oralis TaxID=1303 RepID=A0A139P0C3_STROR|nr:Merozoite surface protein 3 alpha [Streptococcus oralis]